MTQKIIFQCWTLALTIGGLLGGLAQAEPFLSTEVQVNVQAATILSFETEEQLSQASEADQARIEGPFWPKGYTLTAPPAVLPSVVASSRMVVVQPGDTAYSLAKRAGLSVEAFLALNNLPNANLKVGQTVYLSNVTTYAVQPGDTLYSLARRFGVTVEALRQTNHLTPEAGLMVGQVLTLPQTSDGGLVANEPPPSPDLPKVTPIPVIPGPSIGGQDWRAAALSWLGTPYVFGGNSKSGLDCSAFVIQVFGPLGLRLPRVSAEQAQVGLPVDAGALRPGDLLFFDTVGKGRVSHVGIYLGDDTFINANSYKGQVTIDRLMSDQYWAKRYLGARRVMPETLAMGR